MALFNSAMFGGGSGILPDGSPKSFMDDLKEAGNYLWQLDRATAKNPFTGGDTFPSGGGHRPGYGSAILDYLGRLDKATGSSVIGGMVTPTPDPAPNGPRATGDMADWYSSQPLNAPQSGDMGQWYGQQKPVAPQMPSWAQPPAQAGAAIDLPSSSYAMGGTNVPVYGQPENPAIPPNAMPTAGRAPLPQGPLAPQAAQPAMQSELFNKPSTTPVADAYNDFFDRFKEGYRERVDAKKAQAETARGMYEVFVGQGFEPKVAAAKAVIAARNPKVLEEIMKPYANMDARVANAPEGSLGKAIKTQADYKRTMNAAERAGTVEGESQATAQINLPGAVSAAKEQLRLLDELDKHPGRKQFGWHDVLGKAPLVPSTKGYDAENLLTQIKSGAFMTAFETLKGGGQITQTEGEKATAAIARMDRATSRAEFDRALSDYKGVIKLGIDRASQKAGVDAPFGFQGNSGWQSLPNGVRIRKMD